jgi:cytoskeletal protein CcmA (bactofilin family)
MSCPHEWRVAAYVDAGLEPAETRRLEAHLVGCERCRGRVLALREEARALAALLGDEPAAPRPGAAIADAAPARGVAYGLPFAVGVTALATAVATALIEMRLPPGLGWLNPSTLLGVNDMLFDTIFMVRDRAPGWLELATALGALAGLAAIFTFLAGALLRRYAGAGVAVGLVLALGGAEAARAAVRFEHRDSVRVARGETHAGTLAVSCESLEIEGVVVGDVLAFCERVAIRGEVEGSVIAIGREFELRGSVTGNVIAAGHQVTVEGAAGASAYLTGERVALAPGGRVARDAFLAGERVRVEGEVARDLTGFGERVEIDGEVGRDFEARAERVVIQPGARIGGGLSAHLSEPERLEVAEGAVIAGASDVHVLDRHGHTIWSRYREGSFYTWTAVGFVASFLIGLILHALAPSWFAGRIVTGRDFFVSLGLGAAFAVLAPLALVLLALTVVGIPAALIGLAAWAACLYFGAVVVAALLGRSLVKPRGESLREFGMALAVGLAVVVLIRNLPFVGPAAGWVIALVGVGVLVAQAYAAWQRSRRPAA